jgi:hypothetical protein
VNRTVKFNWEPSSADVTIGLTHEFYLILFQQNSLEYPVKAEEGGIKLRPELMQADVVYHCIYHNAVYIFFKDHEELMHCYQVEDPDAVSDIIKDPSNLENILRKYSVEK